MSTSGSADGHNAFQFGLGDACFALAAASSGLSCATQSSWDVGVLVSMTMVLFWCTRRRAYAAVPGAAIGVLIAWGTLPITVNVLHVLRLTAVGATLGASLNALIFRYYLAGLAGIIVVVLMPVAFHLLRA